MANYFVAHMATGLSILSIGCCILFVPYLYNRVNSIRSELQLEMDEFNVLGENVWSSLMHASPRSRKARQVNTICECDTRDVCPPGPPGPSGKV